MNQLLNQIKTFVMSKWVDISLAIGGLITLLLYLFNLKAKEVNGLQAQVALTNTQKKADVLETQIKQNLDNANLEQKEINSNQQALAALDEKRKEIETTVAKATPQQNVDYWNSKK